MLEMTRWNPNADMARFRETFDQLFNRFVDRRLGGGIIGSQELSERLWSPRVNIRETSDAYELFAELPGMSKDDIEITLENQTLTLKGARIFEDAGNSAAYHRVEREYGSFSRSFGLPNRVDASKVRAEFENGVLHLTVPKLEEAKPRRIEIA
ncbi:MAG TPA: Hsp20/alpha crystallin family protein [Thermoanaerobaculia bacterium]|nr:Hsp20/alpha crystallin family protein [Thermoanaerobaculia bacterium]